MKQKALFGFGFLTILAMANQNVSAGSAVAWDGSGHLIFSRGQSSEEVAKENALTTARRRYGANVSIIASSDETGYCAIAVARHPNGRGSIIGVSLGKRSATEADTLAIEKCLKAGGKNPHVKWAFWG